jgi:hypothetical protein
MKINLKNPALWANIIAFGGLIGLGINFYFDAESDREQRYFQSSTQIRPRLVVAGPLIIDSLAIGPRPFSELTVEDSSFAMPCRIMVRTRLMNIAQTLLGLCYLTLCRQIPI